MSAVRNWLEAIGLGQYGDVFEANDIDMELLARIDDKLLRHNGELAPKSIAKVNAQSAVTANRSSYRRTYAWCAVDAFRHGCPFHFEA